MRAQQLLNKVWRWLGADKRLTQILVALLIVQALVVLLPQAPISNVTSPGYSRWLAEQRAILKGWITPLSALGFLTLRTAVWMRGLLILLALVVATRLGDGIEQWRALAHSHRWLHVLSCVAGVLIMAGWGAQTLWGWKQSNVIVWPGEPITISDAGLTLPSQNGAVALFTAHYGLYFIPKGKSVGLVVQAVNEQGQVLPLSPSARDEPQAELRIALTDETPEAYFALPQIGFVFRTSLLRQGDTPILAQVYRSSDGELLAATTVQGDGALPADNVQLQITRYALPRFEAVYNPGAPVEGIGMLALSVAILGNYLVHRKTPEPPAVEPGAEELSGDSARTGVHQRLDEKFHCQAANAATLPRTPSFFLDFRL